MFWVRELGRVATRDTEKEWLEVARGKTVRQIEQLVSGKPPGARPSDPGRPEARRHVLRFDVSAETYATFREATALIRRRTAEPLDDDALLLQLAREILRGPSDAGRSSYQISVTVCERCQRGVQHGAGANVELSPEIVEMMTCDVQLIGRVDTRVDEGSDDLDAASNDVDSGEVSEATPSQELGVRDCDLHAAEVQTEGSDRVLEVDADSEVMLAETNGGTRAEAVRAKYPGNVLQAEAHAEVYAETGAEMVQDRAETGTEMVRAGADTEMHAETGAEMLQAAAGADALGGADGESLHVLRAAEVLRAETDDEVSRAEHRPIQERRPALRLVSSRSRIPNSGRQSGLAVQHTHVGPVHSHAGPAVRTVQHTHVGPVHSHAGPAVRTVQHTHVGPVHSHAGPARSAVAVARPIAAAAHLPKATQSIAPAVRRHVYHRDRGRCVVPGCNFGGFLDVHHLNPRAEGGGHDTENLVTLCEGHHKALHTGQLWIEGSPSKKLRFLRADGTKYTDPPSARTIAVGEQVFGALRGLGFSERQARSAVRHVLETAETLCASTLLRAALVWLSAPLGSV
nr:MAG: hypothetical protein DIU78_12475 [Pseudomonadota bacterium]